jgi:hypothetical protein
VTRWDLIVGASAAVAVATASAAYGVLLLIGLSARGSSNAPIGDPWLGGMEALILFIAPALAALVWSIGRAAGPARAVASRAALAFMTAAAVMTCAVHAVLLLGPRAAAVAAFRWPSPFYVLDIVAWDGFFAISVLIAAPLVSGVGLARWVRRALVLSGVVALAGWAGVPTGDMRLRDIGIFGYAVIFPLAAIGLAVLFAKTLTRRDTSQKR